MGIALDQAAVAAIEFDEAPRTGASVTEDLVATAWARALRRGGIDRDVDFRACGLNANRALQVIRDIWSDFAIELPVNVLFHAPTVRRMAAAMNDGSAFIAAELVPMRAGDEREKLFLFPGGAGCMLEMTHLAAALEHGGAIYGVPFSGLDGQGTIHDRFEADAARTLDIIQRAQPAGPLRLIGHSMGGVTALETARLARQQGRDVAFLGMLDTGVGDAAWPLPVWARFVARGILAHLAKLPHRLRRRGARPATSVEAAACPQAPDQGRRGSRYMLRFRDPASADYHYYYPMWEGHHPPRYNRVRAGATRMVGAYRPSQYDGPVHFFAAAGGDALSCDPRAIWPRYLPSLSWITVPGNHVTMLFSRNGTRLAAEISKVLNSPP